MHNTVNYELRGQTAWLTLNRPEKLNAFTEELNRELRKALKQAGADPEVRAIVITGAGRAFCSGEDLGGVTDGTDHGEILRTRYNLMVMELEKVEKPVIAAVNGVAAGAGLSLALACDFRLASDKASFIQAFIHVGLVPDAGNLYYLPKLVGHAKALELAVLGDRISAEDAANIGLVTKVIASGEWEEQVAMFAGRLAALPTKAVGLIKRNLKASWQCGIEEFLEKDAQAQRIAGLTDDHKEGINAFTEKRKPIFKGY
ncbi:enoyl-CoA hydratase-related protein [Bacillus canaveralius]|uniref:enoyl-CoA hydratase-related protein n=1 Tax=Bacillus canaveralius TaxID=1403243 RepID=UPI000F7BA210|nr:enoyl-CoA hydratase-related protein [Bacillus canaveralius]RSK43058.1 2-(1,2-epoxy-1,2-dihydrophenyl)acetyl-CoA isomerase [Bacillus canaveralius]